MNFNEIKELVEVFDKSELNKLKLKNEAFGISMEKGFEKEIKVSSVNEQVTTSVQSIDTPIKTSYETTNKKEKSFTETINSPMIGTFYVAPSPEIPPFVKVGDTVKKGQPLCILEAMKIMNEVEAECDCKILEVLVKDADPVEYDMPLFAIEKL